MSDAGSASRAVMTESQYQCGTCGQTVTGKEFHSYDSCLLRKAKHGPQLTDDERRYIFEEGLSMLRTRVSRRELPSGRR